MLDVGRVGWLGYLFTWDVVLMRLFIILRGLIFAKGPRGEDERYMKEQMWEVFSGGGVTMYFWRQASISLLMGWRNCLCFYETGGLNLYIFGPRNTSRRIQRGKSWTKERKGVIFWAPCRTHYVRSFCSQSHFFRHSFWAYMYMYIQFSFCFLLI